MSKKVFLAGIGGMGMTPLAIYLSELGFRVFGWDDVYIPENAKSWFGDKKIEITDKIPDNCDFFVHSNAVKRENPLYLDALGRGIAIVRRGEFLAQILVDKKVVAIVGSHGKSSVCALTVHMLRELDVQFSYLIGAHIQNNSFLPGHYCSESEFAVVEVDESDGSIDAFSPDSTIVLNDSLDHTSFYKSDEQYALALKGIAKRSKRNVFLSKTISWADDFKNNNAKHSNANALTVRTFGENGDFDAQFLYEGDNALSIELGGEFNSAIYKLNRPLSVNNLVASLALANNISGGRMPTQGAIKRFSGVKRRCELLLKTEKLTVISDYAHHPDEIDAYLDYTKNVYPGDQIVIYEPHRASRTVAFHLAFGRALNKADGVCLKNVYQAFENKVDQPVNNLIAQHLKNGLDESFFEIDSFLQMLKTRSSKITLSFVGAGNIDAYARKWVDDFLKKIADAVKTDACSAVKQNFDLSKKSTFGIGGEAFLYIEPACEDDVSNIFSALNRFGITWFVLGLGSNVLIPSKKFNGAVLSLSHKYWKKITPISTVDFEVGAGTTLKKLVDFMQENNVGGFEFLDGIPGTVGGALKMNAGAYGSCIFDLVKTVFLIDSNGNNAVLDKKNILYSYRECKSLKNVVATKAILSGIVSSNEEIAKKRMLFKQRREASQPVGRSLGCFFKNTIDESAGRLLDLSGLKGKKVSGVYVSSKHANFIMNEAGRFEDVLKLADYARTTVFQKTNVLLEPEVEILGEKWINLL